MSCMSTGYRKIPSCIHCVMGTSRRSLARNPPPSLGKQSSPTDCASRSSGAVTISVGGLSNTSSGMWCNVSSNTCCTVVACRNDVSIARRHFAPPGSPVGPRTTKVLSFHTLAAGRPQSSRERMCDGDVGDVGCATRHDRRVSVLQFRRRARAAVRHSASRSRLGGHGRWLIAIRNPQLLRWDGSQCTLLALQVPGQGP